MKFSYLVYEPVFDLAELTARMERVAELGYEGIELTATYPMGYPIEDLAATAERIGLPVVSLMSGWSYAHEGCCLSSPDVAVRDRAVTRLIDYVGFAARLGSLVAVGLMQGHRTDEPDPATANRRIAEALGRVARVAEDRGVPIVVEPVNHLQVGFNHTAAEVADLVARIGSPAIGLMLDTIHMNIEERSMLDTVRDYGRQARHFHLAETNGSLYGTGNLDFGSVLTALDAVGYEEYVSIKIYRNPSWEEAARSAMAFLRGVSGEGPG